MKKFFTYILCSEKTNHYYIGQSEDLKKRLIEHNEGRVKSTKHGVPWRLSYFEEFETRSEAYKREQQIKKRKSRKFIETLINKRE